MGKVNETVEGVCGGLLTSMKLVSFSAGAGAGVGAGAGAGIGVVVFQKGVACQAFSADSLALAFSSSRVRPLSASWRRTVRVLCSGILKPRKENQNQHQTAAAVTH